MRLWSAKFPTPERFIRAAALLASDCEVALLEWDETLTCVKTSSVHYKSACALRPDSIVGVYHAKPASAEQCLRSLREDVEAWIQREIG